MDDDSDDEKTDKSSALQSGDSNPIEDKEFAEVAFAINKAILKEVEEMEEKVFAASLQVKVRPLNPLISNIILQILLSHCLTLLIAETGRISRSTNEIRVGGSYP